MTIEERIFGVSMELGYQFVREYKNKTGKHYLNNDAFVKKYFKYFEQAARMFCVRNNFSAQRFIESFFYGEGVKYPQQLPYEKNWEKYKSYISNTKNNDNNEEEVIYAKKLVSSARVFEKYEDMNDFLNKGGYYLQQIKKGYNDFDDLIFWFSKIFNDYYTEHKDEFVSKNPEVIRAGLLTIGSKKIVNKIKQILKEDYICLQDVR